MGVNKHILDFQWWGLNWTSWNLLKLGPLIPCHETTFTQNFRDCWVVVNNIYQANLTLEHYPITNPISSFNRSSPNRSHNFLLNQWIGGNLGTFYLGCSSRNARNYICIEHRYLCLMINDVREKIVVDSYVRLRSASYKWSNAGTR